jgi:NSS family neurotransmitter:Na+ symporter
VTLPIAFGKIPLGSVLAAMFFLLLAAASLTTMLSMLECMTRLFEERFAWRRRTIVTLIAGASWCLGVLAVLSFNVLSDVFPLEMFTFFEGKTFFDLMDYSVANILIPFNGLLIVVFAGWAVSKKTTLMEFGDLSQSWYQVWRFIVRYVAPIGISTIFVLGLS